jgi:hypothetical protein
MPQPPRARMMGAMSDQRYGEEVRWEPAMPRIGLLRLLVSWAVLTASVYVAALIMPGVALNGWAPVRSWRSRSRS